MSFRTCRGRNSLSEPSRSLDETWMGGPSFHRHKKLGKDNGKFAEMFPRWIVPEIKRSQCPKLPPIRSCNAEGRVIMLVDAASAAAGGFRKFSKGIMSVGNYIEKESSRMCSAWPQNGIRGSKARARRLLRLSECLFICLGVVPNSCQS